jgi:hypothetical protein
MSVEYKVPRILWENLESVLLAQSRRYIGELAKRLGISEKELQKRVLPSSDSLKIMIQDSQAESNQCKSYIQHGVMTTYCRKPVAYHSDYCTIHRQQRMTLIPGSDTNEPVVVQKVKDQHTIEPLWVKQNILINSQGHKVGIIYPEENRMKLFVLPQSITQ